MFFIKYLSFYSFSNSKCLLKRRLGVDPPAGRTIIARPAEESDDEEDPNVLPSSANFISLSTPFGGL
jgi:hypothetical protein